MIRPWGSNAPDLTGEWQVADFRPSFTGEVVEETFGAIPAGVVTFEPLGDCEGEGCTFEVTSGPDFLIGATLEPVGDSLEARLGLQSDDVIRAATGGGITCNDIDVTDIAIVTIEASRGENSEIVFKLRVAAPDSSTCAGASVTWTATADLL